jgi:hypothetical protein
MSIDDMIARDTRIDRLARLCGWSRRETRACLEDVWALCYDRVAPYLPADDIEITAERDAISPPAHQQGFVAALIAVGLARPAVAADRFFTKKDGVKVLWKDAEWRDRVYLSGAAERVGYLLSKSEAGRQGGAKSGETRRSKTKQSFDSASSKTQAPGNPSAPDSASASASASVPVVVPELPGKQNQTRERHPEAGAIASAAWQHAAKLQGELVLANVKAPTWPLMHGGSHAGWIALLDRVCELLVDSTPEKARAAGYVRGQQLCNLVGPRPDRDRPKGRQEPPGRSRARARRTPWPSTHLTKGPL